MGTSTNNEKIFSDNSDLLIKSGIQALKSLLPKIQSLRPDIHETVAASFLRLGIFIRMKMLNSQARSLTHVASRRKIMKFVQ